jgi:hypothetical protein
MSHESGHMMKKKTGPSKTTLEPNATDAAILALCTYRMAWERRRLHYSGEWFGNYNAATEAAYSKAHAAVQRALEDAVQILGVWLEARQALPAHSAPKFKVADQVTCVLSGNEIKTILQVVPRENGYGYVIEGTDGRPTLAAEVMLGAKSETARQADERPKRIVQGRQSRPQTQTYRKLSPWVKNAGGTAITPKPKNALPGRPAGMWTPAPN